MESAVQCYDAVAAKWWFLNGKEKTQEYEQKDEEKETEENQKTEKKKKKEV